MSNNDSTSLPATSLVRYGCYLGLFSAAALLAATFYSMGESETPVALQTAMLLTGVIQALACLKALQKSRAGWSLAIALNGTLALSFFFGSGRVSDALGVSLAVGFLPCVVFSIATTLLLLGGDEY